MELLITFAAIALVAALLEVSRRHHPGPLLAGSTDIVDRDNERVAAELRTRP